MPDSLSLLQDLRQEYHRTIRATILGHRSDTTIFSNADKDSVASVAFAHGMAHRMGDSFTTQPPGGQVLGAKFTSYTKDFLETAFNRLAHLRPGAWTFSTSQMRRGISSYDQYEHLYTLRQVLEQHNDLKAAFGGDYFVTPDIVVLRGPLTDAEIDAQEPVIGTAGDTLALHTPLRAHNASHPILHASISCKWTMRSDRSQNTRTEALNLLRNRKGQSPHIVAVVMEPLPTRLASIAMGTGDIDCTYHGALYELREAVRGSGFGDQEELLETLIQGRRLRDISDLPFDLAV